MIEVNFAAHQAMQPVRTYGKLLPEQRDVAGLIATANEDDVAAQRRMGVESEMLRHRLPRRSRFGKRLRPPAMRGDVSIGACLQFSHAGHAVALPNLGLPQGVEAFYGVLHAVLEWRHEHRHHAKLQAQATDAAHGMGVVMRALKHVVVVELGIGRKSVALPAREQQRYGAFGASWDDPSISQRAVQTLGGQYIDQRPTSDFELGDEVKAVKFGLTRYDARQIPPLGRCRASDASHAILQSKARQHTVDAGLRRHACHFSLQRGSDCPSPVFTQNAFTQVDAQLRNTLFDIGRGTVRGATRLSIGKINVVEALAVSTLNPNATVLLENRKCCPA
jgi:hypothetical protein